MRKPHYLSYLLLSFLLTVFSNCYAVGNKLDSNVLIFVSFSMPDASIKVLMQEAKTIHAPLVIRGLVNNSFKETLARFNNLAKDNRGGIQLDPTLFQRYQVKQVPAFVVLKPNQCLPTQTCREDFNIIYGNVHLKFALEQMAVRNDEIAPIAKALLTKLEVQSNA